MNLFFYSIIRLKSIDCDSGKVSNNALSGFYPRLKEMRLIDFKVRVLAATEQFKGTGAAVRVLIESADPHGKWVTVGVSCNIIEASWQALMDSVTYKLYKDENENRAKKLGD